jgi:hypothetical protein
MITICEKHDDIEKICNQKFYRWRLDFFEKENLIEIIEDMEWYFSDIGSLAKEAKKMWQRMEDWLRYRKEIMEEKWIEEEYQDINW